MKTDDLIAALAEDTRPVAPGLVSRRLLSVMATGLFGSVALMLAWLPPRPDLLQALHGGMFWAKSIYTFTFALAGALAIERLSRPAGKAPPLSRTLLLGALGLMACVGLIGLMLAPPEGRLLMWLGDSYQVCGLRIVILSAPLLLTGLMAVRSLAPTRLRAAGFATGLLAGGLSATVYSLHCPESTAAFIATWYSLGMLTCAAIGAGLGPWVLRWR